MENDLTIIRIENQTLKVPKGGLVIPTMTTTYTIPLYTPFDELLCNRLDNQEEFGFSPDSMLIWEPVFDFYQRQIRELNDIKNLSLHDYIINKYDITPHVIGMDQREPEWLKKILIYVYNESKMDCNDGRTKDNSRNK